ncbi:ras and EF-hand domain-containing protein homolog [Anarrhichthys ocellatus]|uniref:ras and EF-hand domain-containing protein homolog n=1 Tax=Anarrhichthys ocellatus TaxID=433405 RepID=UPI0012EEC1D3|nr:ras and EF-hand domain-containing protein homolog [Anarrhichthys ocellatus]
MRKNRSTVNDNENTENMSEDDTILSQNVVGNNTIVTTDITSRSGKDDSVKSNKNVTEEENHPIKETEDVDKESTMQQTNDTSETVGNVTIKDCKTGPESSMYVHVYGQDEDGEQFEEHTKKEHEAQEINVSKEITHVELFSDPHNRTDTLATFDIGLKDENLRAEPAVDVSEESGISSQPGMQEKTNLDDTDNLQGRSNQKRRKMGSTRRNQLHKEPEETRVETKESDKEADMRIFDKMEVVEELTMIATADASQNENAKPSLSLVQQETNETSTVDGKGQKLQSSDLQSNMISNIDYSKALPPEQSASKQELDNANEGAHNKNLEMKNASSHLDSTSRRRKMGSTRRNLGTGTKQEDLHQKQDMNDEATETATNVRDVKTESSSSIIRDELQLHVKPKESGTETMEYSDTGESHKPLAHQTFEENPVSQGQLLETEPQLTPSYLPAIPSTSPKHDLISESASGGRRRKMGSHRKSHGHQNYENQTARGDRITDARNERDVRSIREESGIKTEELREECLGPDQIPKVDESHKNPSSNLSASKEGEHSRPVSEKTPEPVSPVQHHYAEIQSQESQQTFSLGRRADLRSNAYNVMMVGDSSVGKTSFMKRAQSGKFSLDLPASVGLDSCMWTMVVEGKPVVLELWDTAGQERFHSITRQIFHKAHAFLLMYDITSSQSFSAVSYWAKCIQEGAAESVTILLVGNKSDRAERQVKTQEAEILAKEYNFEFMECSAATGENVVQSLETVARMLSQNVDTRDDAMVLHKEPQRKTSRCC